MSSELVSESPRPAPRRRLASARIGALALAAVAACGATPGETPRAAAARVAELRVAPDGSADHRTIQAALDAAPPHAVVHVAPGTYAERITIERPVVLEGSGWERTHVTAPWHNPLEDDPRLAREFRERMQAASSEAQRAEVRARALREHGPAPTLRVRGADGVVVRGLKLSQPGERREDVTLPGSIVEIDGARARLAECAVVGSPASGVVVLGDSDVEIRACLVAAVEATGIAVDGARDTGSPRVLVRACDVRRCVHRGITVGPGNDSTRIERCRISGSEWHGIRYDDAGPTIAGNVFFDNRRSAVYASGDTRAEVRDNLFLGPGGGDLTCWFRSRDRIEGNTFVGVGVSVLGAARPEIRRNVFLGGAHGVKLSDVADDGADRHSTGAAELEENVFWQVQRAAVHYAGRDPVDLPVAEQGGNAVIDPGFVDAARGDYRLSPASPLAGRGVGASEPLRTDSPFPVQPEERPVVERASAEDARREDQQARLRAHGLAQRWIGDVQQARDAGLRAAGVAAIGAALLDDDADRRRAALLAIVGTQGVEFDRAPLRDGLLHLVETESGYVRVDALSALLAGERQDAQDLELVLDNPEPAGPGRSREAGIASAQHVPAAGASRGRRRTRRSSCSRTPSRRSCSACCTA